MRSLIGFCALLLLSSAQGETIVTPAGNVDLPVTFSKQQWTKQNPAPPIDPDVSWGKRDVSYFDYSQDKLDCAFYGLYFALKPQSWSTKGHRNMVTLIMNGGYDDPELRQSGQEEVEHCLRLRGYSQFRMTAEQMSHLSSLRPGSKERELYLYYLARNPEVLERQRT